MPADVGQQVVSILYYSIATSDNVNKRHIDIRKTGIYKGGYLTVTDASHAQLSPLACEITDGSHQVKVETTVAVNIVVAQATPYIILRWSYAGATSDYMEIKAVATPQTYDLVVAKCSFDGDGNPNGISYGDSSYPRSTPNVQDLFLKVESTGETELRVRIRAGRIQSATAVIAINDQKSNLFTRPASNSKVYLVYVDPSTGAIGIDSSGTAAADPTAPSYSGKLVLAEVTLSSTDTSIPASKIKDVRPFITPRAIPDGVTIDYDDAGKLYLKSVPSALIPSVVPSKIDSIFGSWTNLDSVGSVLVKDSVYKVTSDGFVVASGISHGGPVYGYTSSANPPVTEVCREDSGQPNKGSLTMPVRKNEYWKITSNSTVTIRWIPIGSGQCVKQ